MSMEIGRGLSRRRSQPTDYKSSTVEVIFAAHGLVPAMGS
jgi:hypothetical protein